MKLKRHSLPMVRSAQGLIAGKAISMGLGFLFWLFAARLLNERTVGLAAGAVSAAMLCVQFGLLGVESAYVSLYPGSGLERGSLLRTAGTIVGLAGVTSAGAFLLVSRSFFRDLDVVAASPRFGFIFLLIGGIGTVQALLDKVSMARRRGTEIWWRNVVNGAVTLLPLGLIPLFEIDLDAFGLFLIWGIGTLLGTLVAAIQVNAPPSAYEGGVHSENRFLPLLLRRGWPNYMLSLAERSPGLILPILVIEAISPASNAHWYPVWMIAWGAYVVPSAFGTALFAEGSHEPAKLARPMAAALRTSLGLGTLAVLTIYAFGPIVLGWLGDAYLAEGLWPLRVMALAVFPLATTNAYYGICRATDHLRPAIVIAITSAVFSLGAAGAVASSHGLLGIATSWLLVQALVGTWSAFQLRLIYGHRRSYENSHDPDAKRQ